MNYYKKLLAISLLVALMVLPGCLRKKASSGPVDLTFYGLDDSDALDPIISQYREKRSNVRIKYKKFADPVAFENLLVNEIAEGEGPDIFYIGNTWLPRHTKKMVPLASETLTPANFSETFVNVTAEDFIQPDPADGNRKIYALPLFVDTLALYYNKEHFEQKLPERGKPANNWDALKEDANKMREQSEDGKLERGAIALGRSDNIALAPDIFYNFLLQAGVDFYDKEFKQVQMAGAGQEYFDYFVSFAVPQNKNYSWSTELAPPERPLAEVEAFLAGKVSAILAYSDFYPRLENEIKNVRTRNPAVVDKNDVGVARIPQIAADEADFRVLANYYGLAVSRNSKNPKAAWDFVQFAAGKASSQTYHSKTKKPAARRDLIEDQKKEPVTEIFVSQVGYASSFRLYSKDRFDRILKDAMAAASGGQTPRQALSEAQNKMNDLLKLEAPEGLYPKPKGKKKK